MLRWIINIVLVYIIARWTCVDIFAAIVRLPTTIFSFLLFFILNCHRNLIFSQILNLFICDIFEHNFFAIDKEIHKLWFSVINNKCRNQIPVTQSKLLLKYGALSGSTDHGEEDLESDVNCLASYNLQQYTTVPS